MLQENNIEQCKEDGDEKHIKKIKKKNQCDKKAAKALKKKIGKRKCRDEEKYQKRKLGKQKCEN